MWRSRRSVRRRHSSTRASSAPPRWTTTATTTRMSLDICSPCGLGNWLWRWPPQPRRSWPQPRSRGHDYQAGPRGVRRSRMRRRSSERSRPFPRPPRRGAPRRVGALAGDACRPRGGRKCRRSHRRRGRMACPSVSSLVASPSGAKPSSTAPRSASAATTCSALDFRPTERRPGGQQTPGSGWLQRLPASFGGRWACWPDAFCVNE
mmetsp:Transcript_84086/g.214048  ORF Transcript_84086/g.214048 Transcript_84086/m.214048 type:complete len:206 (+) Transcript_84086:174-791(+)